MVMRCAFDRSQGSYLEEGQLSVGEAPMLASSLKLGRSRRLVAGSDVADFKALEHLLNRSHTGDILYSPVLSAAGSPKLMIVVLSPEKARDWSPAEQALLKIFGRFLVQFLQQNRDMADMILDLELSFQARRNAQDQAQRTLELNQKLRDQLVVLQDDIDQKAGQIASMAAILAATAGVQESLSSVQEDKAGIQAEAGELPRLASHDQITEQMLDQLRAENEALSADLQQLSEQVAKRDLVEEGELRLALEEIAILQQTLNESENHIATLKPRLVKRRHPTSRSLPLLR